MSKPDDAQRLAEIISDYRQGHLPPLDTAHVRRWIAQFPADVRGPLLAEVVHVLSRTYASKDIVRTFLRDIATNQAFAGDDPAAFWRGVGLLRLQRVGSSQRNMLDILCQALEESLGLRSADMKADNGTYVYLDDAVYSGGRSKSDLVRWIKTQAPPSVRIIIVALATHRLAESFVTDDVLAAARKVGKTVILDWWRSLAFEDRRLSTQWSDLLRPTRLAPVEQAYLARLPGRPFLRTGSEVGGLGLFSSGDARHLIEQEFLRAGVGIHLSGKGLDPNARPLGYSEKWVAGFGSMFVSHLNVANTTPLVFWADEPWYPLFPRRRA